MGTNLTIEKDNVEACLGRIHNYKYDMRTDDPYSEAIIVADKLIMYAAYSPNSIDELYELREIIHDICENLVKLGRMQVIQQLEQEGFTVKRE